MKAFSLLILLFIVQITPTFATERTNVGKVARYYADDNGTVYLKLKDIDFGGCTPAKSNHYYTLRKEGTNAHPRFEELFAMILVHAETQREIVVRFDDQYCTEYGDIADTSPIARISVNY